MAKVVFCNKFRHNALEYISFSCSKQSICLLWPLCSPKIIDSHHRAWWLYVCREWQHTYWFLLNPNKLYLLLLEYRSEYQKCKIFIARSFAKVGFLCRRYDFLLPGPLWDFATHNTLHTIYCKSELVCPYMLRNLWWNSFYHDAHYNELLVFFHGNGTRVRCVRPRSLPEAELLASFVYWSIFIFPRQPGIGTFFWVVGHNFIYTRGKDTFDGGAVFINILRLVLETLCRLRSRMMETAHVEVGGWSCVPLWADAGVSRKSGWFPLKSTSASLLLRTFIRQFLSLFLIAEWSIWLDIRCRSIES